MIPLHKRAQLGDKLRKAGAGAKVGIERSGVLRLDIRGQIAGDDGKVGAADVHSEHVAGVGVEMDQDSAAPAGRGSVEQTAFTRQALAQQGVDDAADGGARKPGAVGDLDPCQRPLFTHAVEHEQAVHLAHGAQAGATARSMGIARAHVTDEVPDCVVHHAPPAGTGRTPSRCVTETVQLPRLVCQVSQLTRKAK